MSSRLSDVATKVLNGLISALISKLNLFTLSLAPNLLPHILLTVLYTVSLSFLKLIYLLMAVLGLRFCARAFSSCGKQGPLFIAVRGPLTVAASRCGAQAPDAQAQ